MAFVTRIGDISQNICGTPGPHVTGSPKLIVSGSLACTVGSIGIYPQLSAALCLLPGPYVILTGSPKLTVSGAPVARVLDVDSDGGVVMSGSPTMVVP